MTYLRIGGVDLYSEVAGAGEPVLLLHGGFCSLESLRAQSDALAEGHRVYAFERPGHGRSADIDEEYGYGRGVGDTVAYLNKVGLESVHVVGYSDGAIIGLLLALDHPERVRSLTAISGNLDPSAFEDGSGPVLDARPREPKPDAERMHYDRLSPDGPEHAPALFPSRRALRPVDFAGAAVYTRYDLWGLAGRSSPAARDLPLRRPSAARRSRSFASAEPHRSPADCNPRVASA